MQARLATLAAMPVSTAGSSTSGPARASPPSTSRPTANTGCPYAKNLVAEAIRDIIVGYRNANSDRRLRRDRRSRRRHPVLPLPRRLWARSGVRLRPAGAGHECVAGQPAAQLLPVPGRLRGDDRAAAQGRRAAGSRSARGPARRDAGRDHRHDRRLPRPPRRPAQGDELAGHRVRLPHGRRQRRAGVAQRRRRGSRRRLADHQPGCRPDQRGTAARAVVERRANCAPRCSANATTSCTWRGTSAPTTCWPPTTRRP